MYVGDGTWDTERNTFLLPNLVGLNFDTMRYNGMGNRFREMPQYHNLIRGHAVVAAITFLLIVPSAILILRFYDGAHRRAVRIHVWLQILTVLLTTVVFALGWFAVGPHRSLSNPHHGIGLAIYVMVLAQIIGGWWIHSKARTRRIHETLKAMVHRWFGSMIALLGLAQIPLGLTLYGSPRALFVLYALAVSALIFIYFVLSYLDGRRGGSDYSYSSGSAVEERRRTSGLGGLAKAGIAGVGLAALSNRFRRRSRSRASRPEVVGSRRQSASRRHSGSYIEEEKYSRHGRDEKDSGWRDWFLKIGAVAGGVAIAKNLMGRRRNRDRDRDSDVGDYGPPLGGATPINPARLEEGRPLPSGQHPLSQPLHHQRSTSSLSYSSYMSASGEPRRGHGLRNAVTGLGAIGLARNIFKNRRERKEQRRLETQQRQREQEERRARAHNQRLTGDGFPRRNPRRGSLTTSTDYSASTDDRPHVDPGVPPPIPAGVYPAVAAGAATAGQDLGSGRHHNTTNPSNPTMGGVPPTGPVSMPPMPPDTQGIFHPESSGSEAYASAGGRQHRRHRSGRRTAHVAPSAGVTPGVVAAEASSSRHHSSGGGEVSVASPPVSVKVKMHPDGRHVTLRRLPDEEAAAERNRRSKDRHGRRRRGSISSLSGSDGGGNRWRRTEATQRQQAEAMRVESENLAAARANTQNQNLPGPAPPPPPIHESSVGPRPGTASVGSPGTYDGTATDASANYRDNRRRRRAERSQAKLAKEMRQNTVEFE
ncbi:hypothetical protein MMC07_000780 [Pseudocyphellaria aurata]|nr:hypothetical protein [Pseudocyphellaria aurata]